MLDNDINTKIEKVVISSIMFNSQKFADITTKYGINHTYFYTQICKTIFKAFEVLDKQNQSFTPEMICMEAKKDMPHITLDDIALIMAESPIANIDEYVIKIVENNKTLTTLNFLSNLRNEILQNDSSTINSILFNSIKSIEQINDSMGTNEHIKSFAEWETYLKENDTNNVRYQIGLNCIDNALKGGIKLNQLILIAGDAESGKTSLGLQILHNLSKNHKTCYFSLEFSAKSYIERSNKIDKILLKENQITQDTYNAMRINRFLDTDTRELNRLELAIANLAKQGVKFFLIDSQMCIEVHDEKYEVEKQNKKFQVLHKLVQKYEIAIFLIVQYSKADKSSPYGSVIGQYVPSIILSIEKNEKDDDFEYIINIKKNKQEGVLGKNNVEFNRNTLMFETPLQDTRKNSSSDMNRYFKQSYSYPQGKIKGEQEIKMRPQETEPQIQVEKVNLERLLV